MRWPLLLLLLSAACLEPEAPRVVTGEWGGPHLGLIATATGADLEYDCAIGKIVGGIHPDAGGRFSALGEHFPGHGGPIRIDEQGERRPARYQGTVRGTTMTLLVILTDTNQSLGSFTLVRGASPNVFKCL